MNFSVLCATRALQRWTPAVLTLAALATCSCSKKKEADELSADRVALDSEPDDPPPAVGESPTSGPPICTQDAKYRPVLVRGAGAKGGSLVELGTAVGSQSGYAFGMLTVSGSEAFAGVARYNLKGALTQVSLGRVHGQVNPPKVAATDRALLAAVVDNDATSATLRLAKIGDGASDTHVTWGPEVQQGRGDSEAFSLAAISDGSSAVLGWDSYDRSRGRSEVRILPFHPATMKPLGPPRSLTPSSEDADGPLVVASKEGYFVAWVSYLESADPRPGQADNVGLTDEPLRHLRVERLDRSGQTLGTPLVVTERPARSLVFDAATTAKGEVVLAFRSAGAAGSSDAAAVHVARIGLDGTIVRATLAHESLEADAPQLFPGEHGPLLTIYGPGQSVLVHRPAVDSSLVLAPGLFGALPLALGPMGLLTARPRGQELEISVQSCDLAGAEASTKPASP